MIDKITTGTVVAGTVGVLFGVMFDAAFLRPLHDSVAVRETARPQARYITPLQLGCLTSPRADIPVFLNSAASVCIKGGQPVSSPH
jgi:hypothetical protein